MKSSSLQHLSEVKFITALKLNQVKFITALNGSQVHYSTKLTHLAGNLLTNLIRVTSWVVRAWPKRTFALCVFILD